MSVIYECIGLPGSGKSYFVNNLNNNNIQPINLQINYSGVNGNIKMLFNCSTSKLITYIIYHNKYLDNMRFKANYKLSLKNSITDKIINSNHCNIIYDQWLIQDYISLKMRDKLYNYDKLLNEFKHKYFNNYVLLYFDVGIELSINRITSRVNGTSRYDDMNVCRLKKEYKKLNEIIIRTIDNVCNYCKIIHINDNSDVEKLNI